MFLLLVVFWVVGIPGHMYAQWEVTWKSMVSGADNAVLLLAYNPIEEALPKEIGVEITIRLKNSYQVFYQREQSVRVQGAEILKQFVRLPKGIYDVTVDIFDKESGENYLFQQTFESTAMAGENALSDILISYQEISPTSPLVSIGPTIIPTLVPDSQVISCYIEVYGSRASSMTASAVIFKENPGGISENAFTYTSEREKEGQVVMIGRKGVYSDRFPIGDLEEGEYQLVIYLRDNTGGTPEEKTVNFFIEGTIKQRIYQDLPTSITMMKYGTFLPATIDSLLSVSDPEDQEKAFNKSWQRLYGKRKTEGILEVEAEKEMELFYQRIFEADQYLSDTGEDWNSDRGKVYVQYGKPAGTEMLRVENKEMERWIYIKWDLSILFEKRNQQYYLVE
ncbi:MAG: GWxTD domain-containing protein [Bacteroidota bacterium]